MAVEQSAAHYREKGWLDEKPFFGVGWTTRRWITTLALIAGGAYLAKAAGIVH